MNPFIRFPKTSRQLVAAAVAGCFAVGPALACAPTGGAAVVNGTACFNQAGNVLTITNSNGAIINWPTFNVPQNTTTHFQQTSASSSVLNRVLLNEPSVILGTLSSNGRVFLINPAGIMVGPGGRVDTAAFVASTLNITNADFLANRMKFGTDGLGGSAGNVTNQGTITTPLGGSVYLIGKNVSNDNGGLITTPKGETLLAAGSTVELIDSATPGVKVEITGAEGNATNLGEIVADAGRIGIAGVIVRNSGVLNASSVVEDGGRVFLRASKDAYVDGDGRIVTTGKTGGRIDVLGDRVAVMDNAELDASGREGGGYVRVGGDFQGKNPEVPNASETYFGPNARIRVDATEVGDGGTAILWADGATRAYGRISARGGADGGDGGFVEVSGKRSLVYRGLADRRAPRGKAGTLLLDPSEIEIDTAYWGYWDGSEGSGIIRDLAMGHVVIQTSGLAEGEGAGDISIIDGATYSSIYELSLLAHANITSSVSVENQGSGGFTLVAGWNGDLEDPAAENAGAITGGGHFSTRGGSFVAKAGDGITLGTITTTGAMATAADAATNGGDVKLHSSAGSVSVDAILADGGAGLAGDSSNRDGGHGGRVEIVGQNIFLAGPISARGGAGGAGSSTDALDGGRGGDGGRISLRVEGSGAELALGDLSLDARGGDGGEGGNAAGAAATAGGRGGDGGRIYLKSEDGDISLDASYGGTFILASGGQGGRGGHGGVGYAGADGGEGGNAGAILLTAGSIIIDDPDDLTFGVSVIASGGAGGAGGNGYLGYGGSAIFTVKDANGNVICGAGAAPCNGGTAYGGGTYIGGIPLPINDDPNSGAQAGGRGGHGGRAWTLTAEDGDPAGEGNSIPNIRLIAMDGGEGASGVVFGKSAVVESMGGTGGSGVFGRGDTSGWYLAYYQDNTPQGLAWRWATQSWTGVNENEWTDSGYSGSDGWIHIDSQAGVSQPVTNTHTDVYEAGRLRTGRLTFPYDSGETSVGINGNVSFLGQSNYIGSVSGRVNGDFTFDGGEGAGNQSRLYFLGDGAPLAVDGDLSVFSRDYVHINSAIAATGDAMVRSDGAIYVYNGAELRAADIELTAYSSIFVDGTLTATSGDVELNAGYHVNVSGPITAYGGVSLHAGKPYTFTDWWWDGGEGGHSWQYGSGTTAWGGDLTLYGSIEAGGDVLLQATAGSFSPGSITQLWATSEITGDSVVALADGHVSLNGSLTATGWSDGVLVGAGRNLTVSGTIDGGEGGIDLRAGSTYKPDTAIWTTTASGGDLTLAAGSRIESDGSILLQASSGTANPSPNPGDLTQVAGSSVTSYGGSVTVVASRDMVLSGNVSALPAPDGGEEGEGGEGGEGGGEISAFAQVPGNVTIAAGRDLTVAGTIRAESGWVDMTAGTNYDGGARGDWTASLTGGNVLLKSTSAIFAGGGYLWITAEGVAGGRAGSVRQEAGGTISQTSGAAVDIYATDRMEVNSVTAAGSSVALKAGYSGLAGGAAGPVAFGKKLFLGHINAGGGEVRATATGGIYDNNDTTVNVMANKVSLTSYGGHLNAAGTAYDLAISADVAATTGIYAEVLDGTNNSGGIRIQSVSGMPSGFDGGEGETILPVVLKDYADNAARINFHTAGSIANGAALVIDTAGDVSLTAAGDFLNPQNVSLTQAPNALMLGAGGNLTFSGNFLRPSTDLQLVALGTLAANGVTVRGRNVTALAGTLDLGASGGYGGAISAVTDMSLVAGSVKLDDGSYLKAGRDFGGLTSGNVLLNNGSAIETGTGGLNLNVGGSLEVDNHSYLHAGRYAPTNLTLTVNKDIALHNNARLIAGDDVKITMRSAGSTIYINELPGYGASKIISDYATVPGTTYITFSNRSSGGIVIDGLPGAQTVGGGSGFYMLNDTTVASGEFLKIGYAATAPVSNDLLSSILDRVTDQDKLSNPTDDGTRKPRKRKDDDDKDDPNGGDPKDQKNAQKPVGRCT